MPLATAVSDLLVVCRRCGEETPSNAADKTGLCVLCLVTEEIAPIQAEYERHWGKRCRYQAKGISVVHINEQCARIAARVANIVHAKISNPDLAIATLNAHLEQSRRKVESKGSRIRAVRAHELLATA